jgi:RNA-splicing ligase RtcB
MPDYHAGKGCVIGFTMPMTDKVIPNIVGVDIHCNMLYLDFQKRLNFDKSQWAAVAKQIRRHIPMAQKHRSKPALNMERDFPWALASAQQHVFTSRLNSYLGTDFRGEDYDPHWFYELCERVRCKPQVAINSIGTLGGGNHFIEFGHSEATNTTGVTLHSGSRNLGLKVANYWQKIAKENLKTRYQVEFQNTIKEIKEEYPMSEWEARIKAAKNPPTPTGLEYLEGEDMYGYLHDMCFCYSYAHKNLLEMAAEILAILNKPVQLLMNDRNVYTVHNYIDYEDFIIRKGAVRSIKGHKMIIPFNMEDGLLICEGKSNEEWNCSAPHGAGRIRARGELNRDESVDVGKIRERMSDKGIYLSVVPKDEVKEAYKDPKFIEKAIAPTATIVDRIKPIITLKAKD